MGSLIFKLLIPLFSVFAFSQKKCKVLYTEAQKTTFDVIIVHGVPYNGYKWDTIMKGRVYWARHLYDSGIARHIIFTGGSVHSPYYEAKIMAFYAKEIGIPDSVIYTEIKAEHSTENIYYSYKKCRNLKLNKIAFATDPFQGKQLASFIKHENLNIAMIPFVQEILEKGYKPDPDIPDSLAYNPNFVALKDRESWRTRIKGTRGKNIDRTYYENGKLE